jgi:DNA-binding transcriptional MerR regulator
MAMTIGHIARRAGLRASTIRYYERLALLPRPIRVAGQRQYDETVLHRLAVIRFAKYVGFTLAEIGYLLQGTAVRPPTDRWRLMAHEKIEELETMIDRVVTLKRMLEDTLAHTCPKLVERGTALKTATERPVAPDPQALFNNSHAKASRTSRG